MAIVQNKAHYKHFIIIIIIIIMCDQENYQTISFQAYFNFKLHTNVMLLFSFVLAHWLR